MRFTAGSPLREKLERMLLSGLEPSLQPPQPSPECVIVARAAARAAALDALVEKPPASGGVYSSPRLPAATLTWSPGVVYEAALYSCTLALTEMDPVIAAAYAVYLASRGPGWGVCEGAAVVVAFAAAAYAIHGLEDIPVLIDELREDDGVASALLYLAIRRERSYTPRMGYTLPDVNDPAAPRYLLETHIPVYDVLRAASETSIAYRDVIEGFPRSLELSKLPPDYAIAAAVEAYGKYSGLLRRRGVVQRASRLVDAWWSLTRREATPGDVADLGVLAAFLSTLRELDSTLLQRQGETV